MKLEEYMREITLMRKQNYTEYDMYSVIASLMRERENIKKLSLRDVNRRQGHTKRGRIFYGLSSIPDLVILDIEFVNSENWLDDFGNVYGCVEIKNCDAKLFSAKKILKQLEEMSRNLTSEEEQLLGEILWYKKVLYTNGLHWILFELKYNKNLWENIIRLVKNTIKKETESPIGEVKLIKWYKNKEINLNQIEIVETEYAKLNEKSNQKDWEAFLEKLDSIAWENI
ncbi:hypothetical protein QUF55_06305 [Clostridiaceae bacterium HSG29]|nr:hypothetical protein [Clostridiaceae bacterium HSG29]